MGARSHDRPRVVAHRRHARIERVVTPNGIARLAPGRHPPRARLRHGRGHAEDAHRAPASAAPSRAPWCTCRGSPASSSSPRASTTSIAIDLANGDLRWRWSWGSGRGSSRSSPRMKRAGRLVFLHVRRRARLHGPRHVMSGAVVWRLRDRLRFRSAPTIAHESLYAVAGECARHGPPLQHRPLLRAGPLVRARLRAERPLHRRRLAGRRHRVRRRRRPLEDRPHPRHLPPRRWLPRPASAGRARRSIAPSGTSWLAVDDAFIGNTPTGELVAIDASTEELRWRHVLGPRPLEADVPRRLEPVLRGGALFVPCSFIPPPAPRRGATRRRRPRRA